MRDNDVCISLFTGEGKKQQNCTKCEWNVFKSTGCFSLIFELKH